MQETERPCLDQKGDFMGWILFVGIFILLSFALFLIKMDDEKYILIKLGLFYILAVFSFNIGSVPLPFGLAIGLFIIMKKSKNNLKIKRFALLCGLLFFIMIRIFPVIPITDLFTYQESFAELNRFNDVQLIEYLQPDTKEQEELRKYVKPNQKENRSNDVCILMFRTWVLNQQPILIKDPEWLYSGSPADLGFKDSYFFIDDNKTEAFMQFDDGKKYFALFKKQDDKYYLSMIIRYGGIKSGQEPNLFF